jgi:hypothetical protein
MLTLVPTLLTSLTLRYRYRFANAPTAKNRLLQQVYSKATANDTFVVTNQREGLADL